MTGLTETDGGATRQMFPCCLSAPADWARSAEEASQRAAESFLQLLDGDQRDVCRGGSQMPPVGTRLLIRNGHRCCLGSSGPLEALYRGFGKWFCKYTVHESHLGIFRAIPSSHKSNYINPGNTVMCLGKGNQWRWLACWDTRWCTFIFNYIPTQV